MSLHSVIVSVEGVSGHYVLTDDDLRVVFSRFGTVLQVMPVGHGSSATVTFGTAAEAQRSINELNGKGLAGIHAARLRVEPMNTGVMSGNIRKYSCRFEIPIENDDEFQVSRRVIGRAGENMKRIVAVTDAKLRLRGRGSGYLEGYTRTESSEPLHLCVSAPTQESYEETIRLTTELLDSVFRQYEEWCHSKQVDVPDNLRVVLTKNATTMPALFANPGVTAL